MASPTLGLLLLLLAAALIPAPASAIGFQLHHRFSDRVRRWAEGRAVPGAWWPEKGTAEYYAALAHHDRALRGRALAAASSDLSFADGNATVRLSSLGFLHYAIVSLGTPNMTFLVALDTGSDLFWVPCDCKQCAPTTSPDFGQNVSFNIYSPNASSTSKKVLCSNGLCDVQNRTSCTAEASNCPYVVQYVSANTSSSGILVEDILYLMTEDAAPQIIKAPIVFGCGETQTGSFLERAAPNGLFGLGMEKISVPSILSSQGLASNSFSMCFGDDGTGRIHFGDKGSLDQQETPFVIDKSFASYMINITGATVGNDSITAILSALVDSGTSFTYLADPLYTKLTQSFKAQVQEQRLNPDPDVPFEFCFDVSPTQTTISLPEINLTTRGGSIFPVNDPIFLFSLQQNEYFYCLAIMKSNGLNIIGQNFMAGLRIVFDRERLTLGWKNFDCSDTTKTTKGGMNSTRANTTQVTMPKPPSNSSTQKKLTSSLFSLLLLSSTIL
ncbi:aspartyl protease family protein 1-like isoform X1 [Musa acuminata AAA Group]|uniref:aspartyl protease family protein 1-like isoform X1 n=1 Tax=Musa acuminata AAA Group TaxID=214697 RepID=UPI0031D452E3